MSVTLSSWKEIAVYLGKGVRTVQRWERQFALPIRRPSAKSHIIFAIPQELDAWVKRQQRSNGPGPTARISAERNRKEQEQLIRVLEDRVNRLQEQRRTLDLNLTRLRVRIEGLQENGIGKNRLNLQSRTDRGAA